MTETKSESFHRLAGKRVETIEDALRIFSNLSGPSYEWTQTEVEAYFARIRAAEEVALQRFADTKRWQIQALLPAEEEEPEASVETTPDASPPPTSGRESRMVDIWKEAGEDAEILAEMVAMQREVIANLQATIDALRSKAA